MGIRNRTIEETYTKEVEVEEYVCDGCGEVLLSQTNPYSEGPSGGLNNIKTHLRVFKDYSREECFCRDYQNYFFCEPCTKKLIESLKSLGFLSDSEGVE